MTIRKWEARETYTPDDPDSDRRRSTALFASESEDPLQLIREGMLQLGWRDASIDANIDEIKDGLIDQTFNRDDLNGFETLIFGNDGQTDIHVTEVPADAKPEPGQKPNQFVFVTADFEDGGHIDVVEVHGTWSTRNEAIAAALEWLAANEVEYDEFDERADYNAVSQGTFFLDIREIKAGD